MTLAIDLIDGHGLSYEVRRELLPKRNKEILCYPIMSQHLCIQLYITNKMECFSSKSRRAIWVAKLIKEYWSIVLQQLHTSIAPIIGSAIGNTLYWQIFYIGYRIWFLDDKTSTCFLSIVVFNDRHLLIIYFKHNTYM